MISVSFTKTELSAVIFAVGADLETVLSDPEDYKKETFVLQTALHKLKKADRLGEDGEE